MRLKIQFFILDWIEKYYGPSEKEEPCYDIKLLAACLTKFLQKELKKDVCRKYKKRNSTKNRNKNNDR